MIGIKDFKMPKSCSECPLTYLDMGDDAYFGASARRCVIDDSCIDGMASERAYDCPWVEAIPKADYEEQINENKQLRAHITLMQADYNARLKADMVAMLTDLQLEIEEHKMTSGVTNQGTWNECIACCSRVIQQKINALKGEQNT